MNLEALSPSSFENLIYDLIVEMGLLNASWRTPGRDGGRDIEGYYVITDLSGYKQTQKWYVECKRYAASVDWPTVREKIAYAENHLADILLAVTTSSLSPQAVDEVNRWNERRYPRVRYWNGHEVIRLLHLHPSISIKYFPDSIDKTQQSIALADLSLLAVKFTQSANSHAVFFENQSKPLEAAGAIADLILDRTDRLNRRLISYAAPIRTEDSFDWMKFSDLKKLDGVDRFGYRAFCAVLRTMDSSLKLDETSGVLPGAGISIILTKELSEGQRKDLFCLAQHGDLEVNFERNSISLKGRKYL